MEEARHNGRTAPVVFLVLHRVFDALPNYTLPCRLLDIGACGGTYAYLKAYDSGRTLRMRIEAEPSSTRQGRRGVPQGSVPNALLFSVALAGPPECLAGFKLPTVRAAVYADAIFLWCVGSFLSTAKVRALLQHSIKKDAYYAQRIGLGLSSAKFGSGLHHRC